MPTPTSSSTSRTSTTSPSPTTSTSSCSTRWRRRRASTTSRRRTPPAGCSRWYMEQILREAGTFEGGLDRGNMQVAARQIDAQNPFVLDGIVQQTSGFADAYLNEGGQMAVYDGRGPDPARDVRQGRRAARQQRRHRQLRRLRQRWLRSGRSEAVTEHPAPGDRLPIRHRGPLRHRRSGPHRVRAPVVRARARARCGSTRRAMGWRRRDRCRASGRPECGSEPRRSCSRVTSTTAGAARTRRRRVHVRGRDRSVAVARRRRHERGRVSRTEPVDRVRARGAVGTALGARHGG